MPADAEASEVSTTASPQGLTSWLLQDLALLSLGTLVTAELSVPVACSRPSSRVRSCGFLFPHILADHWTWSHPQLHGVPPSPRASHSIVQCHLGGHACLVVIGGMCADVSRNDCAILDLGMLCVCCLGRASVCYTMHRNCLTRGGGNTQTPMCGATLPRRPDTAPPLPSPFFS